MTRRILKPAWLIHDGPLKTLHEKGIIAYKEHWRKNQNLLKEAESKKMKEHFQYLINIENIQGKNDLPYPYDLAKITGCTSEMLQICRENDNFFNYKRSFPSYEYDPSNYCTYDYPNYEEFNHFINDDGEDYQNDDEYYLNYDDDEYFDDEYVYAHQDNYECEDY
jgi:hypothetical protein